MTSEKWDAPKQFYPPPKPAAAKKEGMLPDRFFCQTNGTLAAYGQPRLLDPPKRERLRPNPVEALEIRNQGG